MTVNYRPVERKLPPEVTSMIERIWGERLKAKVRLYNGSMLQYLRHGAQSAELAIDTTDMSYKEFVAPRDTEFQKQFAGKVNWVPLSVGTTLQGADGSLILGQRRSDLDNYPGMMSSFAGWVDPTQDYSLEGPDLFQAVIRELEEEGNIGRRNIRHITCLGLLEPDNRTFVYVAFHIVSNLRSQEIMSLAVDSDEFETLTSVDMGSVRQFLKSKREQMTPDCEGNIALFLKHGLT